MVYTILSVIGLCGIIALLVLLGIRLRKWGDNTYSRMLAIMAGSVLGVFVYLGIRILTDSMNGLMGILSMPIGATIALLFVFGYGEGIFIGLPKNKDIKPKA